VAANNPPTATITSPSDGTSFAWKPTITITATATDPGGSVSKVEFLDGGTVLAQKTTAPTHTSGGMCHRVTTS
jgi:chitinase